MTEPKTSLRTKLNRSDPIFMSRLRWRCRRGIREMDLLLEAFLSSVYPELPPAGQRAFERLLDETDLDLMDWIAGRAEPPDPDFRLLVVKLRELRPDAGG